MAAGARPELAPVRKVLAAALAERAFPGCVLGVGRAGEEWVEVGGTLAYDDPAAVAKDTIYDIASLTKVVATTTAAMVLVERGLLDLEAPLRSIVPECQGPGVEAVRIRHLLTHSSGWPAWAPLYLELRGREAFLARVASLPLEYEPGSRSVYSDLGFMLLGVVIERVTGRPFEVWVQEEILGPLGMQSTMFLPPEAWRPRIAPTELDDWRGRLLRGEVHDENAHAMGGVAPHAGLFSTAEDLGRLARAVLGGTAGGRHVASARTVAQFTVRAGIPGSTWALGWDTPSCNGYSAAGTRLSNRAFGGLGFTGTSLWLDPERDLYVVLLTNRVHPTRKNDLIRTVRPAVMDEVVRALDVAR